MVGGERFAYHPELQIREVEGERRLLKFTNGAEAGFDLLAYVASHRVRRVVRESGLVGESGCVAVQNVDASGKISSRLVLEKTVPADASVAGLVESLSLAFGSRGPG